MPNIGFYALELVSKFTEFTCLEEFGGVMVHSVRTALSHSPPPDPPAELPSCAPPTAKAAAF